jgi:hypothetical protein
MSEHVEIWSDRTSDHLSFRWMASLESDTTTRTLKVFEDYHACRKWALDYGRKTGLAVIERSRYGATQTILSAPEGKSGNSL